MTRVAMCLKFKKLQNDSCCEYSNTIHLSPNQVALSLEDNEKLIPVGEREGIAYIAHYDPILRWEYHKKSDKYLLKVLKEQRFLKMFLTPIKELLLVVFSVEIPIL